MTHRAHTLHIPVMGTGFTIDTPLKVARYGISSVISLVDDALIEQMRAHHARLAGEPYAPILTREDDARARRVTAYLNLVDLLVERQSRALQASPFEEGSEITRYFSMLPETPLKDAWRRMLATEDPAARARQQDRLRPLAVPGSIDVNIMTKLDRDLYRDGVKFPPEQSDAMAALRGFALSTPRGSMVLSAGLNPRLYTYMAQFEDFLPGLGGDAPRKRVVLKVSDYRSAIIQGKFLAKRGIWISEFRVESGLNCGGHAFASNGALMGPILDKFKRARQALLETLHEIYAKTLADMGRTAPARPLGMRVTVQGGVGTADEHNFLMRCYEVDGVGWATPFLLVPEATNVDPIHLERLCRAGEDDVYLSDTSPLGVPFWSLKTSASEQARLARVAEGRPGSLCPKSHLTFNTEFTKQPICTASAAYQKRKLAQLDREAATLDPEQAEQRRSQVTIKTCICHDLGGGAAIKHGIDPKATTCVCCGPNIVNFSRVATLEEMVGHVYGRLSLLTNPDRSHMFINEMKLYIDYLRKEIDQCSADLTARTPKYFQEFRDNLFAGIEHYRRIAEEFIENKKDKFLRELERLQEELEAMADLIPAPVPIPVSAGARDADS
jgi:hypothetical protein